MLGNGHGKAARNGGEDQRTWDLCDGERDMGKDGETGEDERLVLAIFESGEDRMNGGSIAAMLMGCKLVDEVDLLRKEVR